MLEVIVSLTLVSTILLVSLTASANIMRNRATAAVGVQRHVLAGYFLDEISTLAYRDASDNAVFGPEPGESSADRSSFDDVDDFHGFREVSPTFRDGASIPNYENWTVNVAIAPMDIVGSGFSLCDDASSRFRLVTVTVTSPDGVAQTFRIVNSITAVDRPVGTSFERLRRVEVRFSDDRVLNVVVPLRNTPEPVY